MRVFGETPSLEKEGVSPCPSAEKLTTNVFTRDKLCSLMRSAFTYRMNVAPPAETRRRRYFLTEARNMRIRARTKAYVTAVRDMTKGREMRPYLRFGADDGARTRNPQLGKLMPYH